MINRNFEKLLGRKRRKDNQEIDQFYMNVAASIQSVLEEVVINLLNKLYCEYPFSNLCLAGGVALNCVMNSEILKKTPFKKSSVTKILPTKRE